MSVLEIRKVNNGFIVLVRNEDDSETEFVFDTPRKLMKFVKDTLGE